MYSLLLACLLYGNFTGQATADDLPFAQYRIQTGEDGIRLLLDGQIEYEFSRASLEALDNGLPLVLQTTVKILSPRKWFWDRELWSHRYEHVIEYHALSQQYLVKGLQSSSQQAYLTRSSALQALGRIDNLQLLDLAELEQAKRYVIRVHSGLSSDALPVPLRPLTFLSDSWKLSGEWITLSWHNN